MNKLPVFETFWEGLKFPAQNIGAVLRRSAIPLGVLIAIPILLGEFVAPDRIDGARTGEVGQGILFLSFVMVGVALVAYGMVVNGVIQLVNNHPLGRVWFSLGTREARFLLTLVLIMLVMTGAGLLAVLPGFLLGSGGISAGPLNVVFFLIAIALYLWVGTRVLPIYGFVAVENRFALKDAWNVSAGYFWRIFAVLLLLLLLGLLILIVLMAVLMPIMGIIAGTPDTAGSSADPAEMISRMQTAAQIVNLITLPFSLYWFYAACAIQGLIYKKLVPSSENTADADHSAA